MDVLQINLQSGAAAVESNPAINVCMALVLVDQTEYLPQDNKFTDRVYTAIVMFY
jgi:hypothetical protein